MNVNVVIGRFQVPQLTEGHRYLLDHAHTHCSLLIVLLGCSGGQPTKRNPLDYATREAMIKSAYPKAIVRALYDHPSDEAWSKRVDEIVKKGLLDADAKGDPWIKITLYGSRDNFKDHYHGEFPVVIIPEYGKEISGTEVRDKVGSKMLDSELFRSGMIYSVYNRYPGVYLCVDVAILTERQDAVLLGRKAGMDQWQFIGGFVDPTDANIAAAARRETWEETELHAEDLKVVGTFKVPDSRYRGTEASMFTVFYKCTHKGGMWKASDDIDELCWFPINTLRKNPYTLVIGIHQPLLDALIMNINNERA